jgi:hypothetical protein
VRDVNDAIASGGQGLRLISAAGLSDELPRYAVEIAWLATIARAKKT